MTIEKTKEFAKKWIEEGRPCKYRCGFRWKGAWLRPLDNDKALEMLPKYNFTDNVTFYELLFEDVEGVATLIFNEYSANDMW